MISFIRRIIQVFAPRSRGLLCPQGLWLTLSTELERRGGKRHEAGAFLLGHTTGNRRLASEIVFYDDLDPRAYASGVCILTSDAFARLWAICRERRLTVVADVHTHPGIAYQSLSDRTNPMVAQAGHVAIILPNFAQTPVDLGSIGVFEYRGDHQWHDRSPARQMRFFEISKEVA